MCHFRDTLFLDIPYTHIYIYIHKPHQPIHFDPFPTVQAWGQSSKSWMLINYSRNRGCAPPQKNRNTSLALTMFTVIFTPWFLLDLREHVQETMVVASCWDLLISIADFPCRKSRKKKQNCRSDHYRCPRHCLEFLPFALPAFEPTAVGINQHLCVREILSLGQSTGLEKSYNHVYTVYIYTK